MLYRSAGSDEPKEVHLDPYLLEPSTASAATYVMGYSHEHNAVRTFKMERIAEVETTNEAFEPSHVDEILEQLARSWGVVYGGEEEYDITVDFSPNVADRVRESYWNPAQKLEDLAGGGVRLSLRLPSLMEFEPWVRSWGGDAVVVEPQLLRERVAASMRAAASLYA
jgi:predicted DNA-binding transcriptional regulator YafY